MENSINIQNLILAIDDKIESSTDKKEVLILSKSVEILKTGIIFVVDTFFELPSASKNLKKLYLVKNDGIIYFAVDNYQSEWIPIISIYNDQLFGWGENRYGEVGTGTMFNCISIPTLLCSSDRQWCQISASGYNHGSAIKRDGTLWTWGYNNFGQLGQGNFINRCSPGTVVGGGNNWKSVVSTEYSTMAIKSDGTLWTWGENNQGQLGDGTTIKRNSPGTVAGGGTNWAILASNSYDTNGSAIKTDGTLWTWGANYVGSLGDGTTVFRCSPGTVAGGGTTWCQVSSGFRRGAGVKTDGTLWTWGENISGQLGNGTTVSRCSPGTVAGGGTTWCFVDTSNRTDRFMFALKTDGTLWSWGGNTGAGLLNSYTFEGTTRCSPGTTIGNHTDWCAVSITNRVGALLKKDGTLWTWNGNNFGYSTGDGSGYIERASPGSVFGAGNNWSKVSTSAYRVHAISTVTL